MLAYHPSQMYQTDYGEYGDGVMEKLPDHHLKISEHGTTVSMACVCVSS